MKFMRAMQLALWSPRCATRGGEGGGASRCSGPASTQVVSFGWVVLLAAGLLTVGGCSGESPSGEPARPQGLQPTEVPPPVLASLSDRATSGQAVKVGRALEMPPGETLDEKFVTQLGRLTIEFQPETAVSSGKRQVRVDAVVTDESGDVADWYVVLDEVDGDYLIATTEEKP